MKSQLLLQAASCHLAWKNLSLLVQHFKQSFSALMLYPGSTPTMRPSSSCILISQSMDCILSRTKISLSAAFALTVLQKDLEHCVELVKPLSASTVEPSSAVKVTTFNFAHVVTQLNNSVPA